MIQLAICIVWAFVHPPTVIFPIIAWMYLLHRVSLARTQSMRGLVGMIAHLVKVTDCGKDDFNLEESIAWLRANQPSKEAE